MQSPKHNMVEIDTETFTSLLHLASDQEKALKSEIDILSRSLELFTYSTSHDLRAPITSMMGLVNLLEEEKDSEKRNLYVQLMRKILNRQDFLIRNILELLKSSRNPINRDLVAFDKVIEETFESLSFLENYKNVTYKNELNTSLNIPFYSDLTRIKVLFNNLISNAIKFQNPLADTPIVSIVVDVSTEVVLIQILDNGIGIKEVHKDKIFDMFYRATDRCAGAGLGLYIVKEILRSLKGNIKCFVNEEGLTCFQLEIPNLINASIKEE